MKYIWVQIEYLKEHINIFAFEDSNINKRKYFINIMHTYMYIYFTWIEKVSEW